MFANAGLGALNLGFPDVAQVPAGPAPVPVPYPNLAPDHPMAMLGVDLGGGIALGGARAARGAEAADDAAPAPIAAIMDAVGHYAE